MRPFNPLPDHMGSLSTSAIKTLTHGFHTILPRLTHRQTAAIPTKFLLGYPALLPASGGDPDLGFSLRMNDGKNPFSFKANNITVSNQFSAKRIYHHYRITLQNKFWFNPDQVNNRAQGNTEQVLNSNLRLGSSYPETISSKKSDQSKRAHSPSKITSRPKGLIHLASIAGEGK